MGELGNKIHAGIAAKTSAVQQIQTNTATSNELLAEMSQDFLPSISVDDYRAMFDHLPDLTWRTYKTDFAEGSLIVDTNTYMGDPEVTLELLLKREGLTVIVHPGQDDFPLSSYIDAPALKTFLTGFLDNYATAISTKAENLETDAVAMRGEVAYR
jgi:hypothetical protein